MYLIYYHRYNIYITNITYYLITTIFFDPRPEKLLSHLTQDSLHRDPSGKSAGHLSIHTFCHGWHSAVFQNWSCSAFPGPNKSMDWAKYSNTIYR